MGCPILYTCNIWVHFYVSSAGHNQHANLYPKYSKDWIISDSLSFNSILITWIHALSFKKKESHQTSSAKGDSVILTEEFKHSANVKPSSQDNWASFIFRLLEILFLTKKPSQMPLRCVFTPTDKGNSSLLFMCHPSGTWRSTMCSCNASLTVHRALCIVDAHCPPFL